MKVFVLAAFILLSTADARQGLHRSRQHVGMHFRGAVSEDIPMSDKVRLQV
jgi:hypothetical protein